MLFFVLCASVCLFLSLCVCKSTVDTLLKECVRVPSVYASISLWTSGVGRCINEQSLFNFGVKPNNFIAAIHKLFDVYFLSVPDASPLIFKESRKKRIFSFIRFEE